MKNLRGFFLKFNNNLKSISFEGATVTIALVFVIVVLVGNIFRVIEKGQSNTQIYAYESNLLNELKKENKELNQKYNYIASDEYKQVLARDVLGLGTANEEFYSVKKKPVFYELRKKLLNYAELPDYKKFWKILIGIEE